MRWVNWGLTGLLGLWVGCSAKEEKKAPPPSPEVEVVQLRLSEVRETGEYLGTLLPRASRPEGGGRPATSRAPRPSRARPKWTSTCPAAPFALVVREKDGQTVVGRRPVTLGALGEAAYVDIGAFYVRSEGGEMIPLESLVTVKPATSAQVIRRYNLFRSAEINGQAAPGVSSGQAMSAMEDMAAQVLPQGTEDPGHTSISNGEGRHHADPTQARTTGTRGFGTRAGVHGDEPVLRHPGGAR
jgi:hypothetical protein